VAATGIISEAILAGRELFAASATWQSWTGTLSEGSALLRVRGVAARDSTIERPLIIVSAQPVHRVGRGGFSSGALTVIFEDLVPEAYQRGTLPDGEIDNEAGSEDFLNKVGAVLKEAMDVSENGGRLMALNFDLEGKLTRSSSTEKVDYFQLRYKLTYGAEK
jgi:hypothetical protein